MESNDYINTGTLVGQKYRIEVPIGSGGMGTVYRAEFEAIGRKVAIKVLNEDLSTDPIQIERFHREARAAGSIGHDNICDVIDIGTTAAKGAPFLVMPLLRGDSLAGVLKREKLTQRRLVDIVLQTLSALAAAHDSQIVHRDLKPDNIFVTRVGDRSDFVKVLDFGISKVMNATEPEELTHSGVPLGTPHYMSPEQAKGASWIDHRVDIYAIGVIMYEALTGRRPFIGNSFNNLIYKLITEIPPAPDTFNKDLKRHVTALIVKAMSREPAKRFDSAFQMREELLDAAIKDGVLPESAHVDFKDERISDPKIGLGSPAQTTVRGGSITASTIVQDAEGVFQLQDSSPATTVFKRLRGSKRLPVLGLIVATAIASVFYFIAPGHSQKQDSAKNDSKATTADIMTTAKTPEHTARIEKLQNPSKDLGPFVDPSATARPDQNLPIVTTKIPRSTAAAPIKKTKLETKQESKPSTTLKGRSGMTFITEYRRN